MEPFKKRVNSLTKSLIILFLISFIYFLHKLDFHDKFRQHETISQLATFVKQPPVLNQGLLRNYICSIDSNLSLKNTRLRINLANVLFDLGIKEREIIDAKSGFKSTVRVQDDQYEFIYFREKFDETSHKLKSNNQALVVDAVDQYRSYAKSIEFYVVTQIDTSSLSQSLYRLSLEMEADMKAIKDNVNRKKTESGTKSNSLRQYLGRVNEDDKDIELNNWGQNDYLERGKGEYDECKIVSDSIFKQLKVYKNHTISDFKRIRILELLNLSLANVSIRIGKDTAHFDDAVLQVGFHHNCDQTLRRMKLNIVDTEFLPYVLDMPIQIKKIASDKLSIFATPTCFINNNKTVSGLNQDHLTFLDELHLQNLKAYYGEIPLEKAKALLEEDYLKIFKTINIFGFEISTKYFSYAILFFASIILIPLYFTIRIARTKKYKLFKSDIDEDVFGFYVNKKSLRLTCWLIVPLLMGYIAFPFYQISTSGFTLITIWCVMNGILGLFTFINSLKLN